MFHRQLHGAAGAWIIGLLSILTVSGIALAFPRTTRAVLDLEQWEPTAAAPPDGVTAVPETDIDRAMAFSLVLLSHGALFPVLGRITPQPEPVGEPAMLIDLAQASAPEKSR